MEYLEPYFEIFNNQNSNPVKIVEQARNIYHTILVCNKASNLVNQEILTGGQKKGCHR